MKRIRKGDEVIVTTGKYKGHIGKVLKVAVKKTRQLVLVENANLVKKHKKGNGQQPGTIESKEAFLDYSNVAMYNPVTKKADKVGFKFIEKDGQKKKVRYFKSNDELVDMA